MISSRPNLTYLKAAWAAHASISAENCKRSFDDAGISFERVNHSWIVRKNNTQVSTMPLRYTRQELRMGFLGRIEMEARKAASEMEAVLFRDLELPEHTIDVELEDAMRRLRHNGHRAMKIFISPTAQADTSLQVFVEIHVFFDAPRACVYARQHDAEHGTEIDLLAHLSNRQRHPRANSFAELAQLIVTTIHQAVDESPSR